MSVVAMLSQSGARNSRATHSPGWRRSFVVLQMALCLVLLTGAALLAASFTRLSRVDPGVSLESVLTMRVTLPWERYEGRLDSFYQQWLEEAGAIPG